MPRTRPRRADVHAAPGCRRLRIAAGGDLDIEIRKTRTGSFSPTRLHPRRRIDRALHAVVTEAYVHGVSTLEVDDLVEALGVDSGVSKSEVSRICADSDAEVEAFRTRALDGQATPYVVLDATCCKVRVRGRVASQVVVIATSVTADGHREVPGCTVGDAETLDFWKQYPTSLRDRGLHGVQLVIPDQHRGLVSAIEQSTAGASWQGCRVHLMRNVLVEVAKEQSDAVAAMVGAIFAQPSAAAVGEQVRVVADNLRSKFPVVADSLDVEQPA